MSNLVQPQWMGIAKIIFNLNHQFQILRNHHNPPCVKLQSEPLCSAAEMFLQKFGSTKIILPITRKTPSKPEI
jgi:hypothetical protein